MGKLARFMVGIVVGLVLVLGVGLTFTVIRGEELIRNHLVAVMTETLGTPAQIASLKLNPIKGTIQVRSLQVNNPPGLTTPYFMNIGSIDIEVKPLSLLQEVIQIPQVSIRDWQIMVEQSFATGNLFEIMAHLQKQGGTTGGTKKLGDTKKVAAGKITIGQINTLFKASLLNQSFERSFVVDGFEATKINSDNASTVLLSEFIRGIVLQTAQKVIAQGRESFKQAVKGLRLPGLPSLDQNLFNSLEELLKTLPQ